MKRLMLLALAVGLTGCAQQPTAKGPDTAPRTEKAPPKGPAAKAYQPPEPVNPKDPVVLIETSMGPIKVELFEDKAPITVKNFLTYVDDKFYDGTIFHRVIPTFMIQGGGMEPGLKEKTTRDTIKNESDNGLLNRRGTLAMARKPQPNSASAQFFINVANNSFLDRGKAQDGVGYAVFGQVLDGMDVADKIKSVKTEKKQRTVEVNGVPQPSEMGDVPVEDVIIKSIRRVEK